MITLKLNPYSDAEKETLLHALAVAHAEVLYNCPRTNCCWCKSKQPCEDLDRAVRYLQSIVNTNS